VVVAGANGAFGAHRTQPLSTHHSPVRSVNLPDLLAGAVFVALNAYAVLGGADFGGGVWDLFASGPRRERQRELVAEAIGPVWEANHVWLILAIVLLFTCFPPAFARLGTLLHIPLSLVLIGIVLRGSAFTFWRYGGAGGAGGDEMQRRWGMTFAMASLITPLLLGTTAGAIASGAVGDAAGATGAAFYETYVAPWLTPFALAVGLFALVAFAFLAAVYLTLEARERDLQEDFRRRALVSGIGLFVAAGVALLLSLSGAPLVRDGLIFASWAVPLHLLTGAAAITALVALWYRRWRLARLAAVAQVSLILWGWALGQYPYVVPPDLTIAAAAAPDVTLRLVLGALAVGAALLLPSLYYLFRVFKGSRQSSVISPQ
jgi:cytochrome bd ubiquinol oxidase subunit II